MLLVRPYIHYTSSSSISVSTVLPRLFHTRGGLITTVVLCFEVENRLGHHHHSFCTTSPRVSDWHPHRHRPLYQYSAHERLFDNLRGPLREPRTHLPRPFSEMHQPHVSHDVHAPWSSMSEQYCFVLDDWSNTHVFLVCFEAYMTAM